MTVPQGSPPRSDTHDAAEATELHAWAIGRLTKNKKRGNFYHRNISGEGIIFYYSFRLIQENRRRVKSQTLQFYINSKTIELQRVKTVIILGKMVSLRIHSRFEASCIPGIDVAFVVILVYQECSRQASNQHQNIIWIISGLLTFVPISAPILAPGFTAAVHW